METNLAVFKKVLKGLNGSFLMVAGVATKKSLSYFVNKTSIFKISVREIRTLFCIYLSKRQKSCCTCVYILELQKKITSYIHA